MKFALPLQGQALKEGNSTYWMELLELTFGKQEVDVD